QAEVEARNPMALQPQVSRGRRARIVWGLAAAAMALLAVVVASRLTRVADVSSLEDVPPAATAPEAEVETDSEPEPEPESALESEPEPFAGSTIEVAPDGSIALGGTVKDRETGKPVAGAEVVIRRLFLQDEPPARRVLGETRHTTDADG